MKITTMLWLMQAMSCVGIGFSMLAPKSVAIELSLVFGIQMVLAFTLMKISSEYVRKTWKPGYDLADQVRKEERVLQEAGEAIS